MHFQLGRRVAVYGGGNTAMDAARTAKRLGAETMIIYRRDRSTMPAHDFEADEALEEGVQINWLRTIKEIDKSTFKVEVMELDENKRPQPTGRFEELEADSLILALGQDTDTKFLETVPGIEFEWDHTVIVDDNMMTGHEGIFAGGDMVPSERSVTIAVGHGVTATYLWCGAADVYAETGETALLETSAEPVVDGLARPLTQRGGESLDCRR